MWPTSLRRPTTATTVSVMNEKSTKNCDLLSGAEARNPEFIIKLFERLKGQPATAGESADLEREITAAARETKP
jgi:hypothetical protein